MTQEAIRHNISQENILGTLIRHKIKIVISTVLLLFLSLLLTFILPTQYEAKTTFFVKETDKGNGGVGGLAAKFGGLASLADINIGGESGSKDVRLAILMSRDFSYKFIETNKLIYVFFNDKWDEDKQKWRPLDVNEIPTAWDAYNYFDKKVRSLSEDKLTGLQTLAIKWKDPILAEKWANELVRSVDEVLRIRDREEAESSLAFLRKELRKTVISEVKISISGLVQVQLQKLLLTNTNKSYAFDIIDQAIAPDIDDPVWPLKIVFLPVGLILGLLFGVFISFVSDLRNTNI